MLEEELENELNEISDTEEDDFDFTLPLRGLGASSDPVFDPQDLDFDKEMMDLAASTTLRMSSIAPVTLPSAVLSVDTIVKSGGFASSTNCAGIAATTGSTTTSESIETAHIASSENEASVLPVVDEVTLRFELEELVQDMYYSLERLAELAAEAEIEAARETEARTEGGIVLSNDGASTFLGTTAAVVAPSVVSPVAAATSKLFEIHDESDVTLVNSNSGGHDEVLQAAMRQANEAEDHVVSVSDQARGLVDSMGEQQRQHGEQLEAQLKLEESHMEAEIAADLAARNRRKERLQAEILKARRARSALVIQCAYRRFKALKIFKWNRYTAERLAKERAAARHSDLIWHLVEEEVVAEAVRELVLEERKRLEEAELERLRVLAVEQQERALREERRQMLSEERLMVDMHTHWRRVEEQRQLREWAAIAGEDKHAGECRVYLTSTLAMDRATAAAAAETRRLRAAADQQAVLERLQQQFRGSSNPSTEAAAAAAVATRTPTPPPFSAAFGGFVSSVKKIVGAVTSVGSSSNTDVKQQAPPNVEVGLSNNTAGCVTSSDSDAALLKIIEAQNKARIDNDNALGRVVGADVGVVGMVAGISGISSVPSYPPLHSGPTTSTSINRDASTAAAAVGTGYASGVTATPQLVRLALLLSLQQWRDHWLAAPQSRFQSLFLSPITDDAQQVSVSVRQCIKTAWEIRGPGSDTDDSLIVTATAADALDSLNALMQRHCSFAGGKNRSKVRKLDICDNKLKTLVGVDALVSLQELLCSKNQLVSIADIRLSPCCQLLRVLKLDSNSLTDRSWLDLVGKHTGSAPLFPCMETLSMNGNLFTMLPDFGANFPVLSRLELGHNQISCCYGCDAVGNSDSNINSLRHLASLAYLNLGRNRLAYVDGGLFSLSCPLLNTLILSQNQLTSAPHQLYLAQLKELRLNDNKLTHLNHWRLSVPTPLSATGEPLLPMQSIPVFLPMLERLYLHDNLIEHISATSLIGVSYNLCALDLSFNNISRLDCVQGLRVCQRLQQLLVHDNPIHALFVRKDTTQCVVDVLPCVSSTLTSDDTVGMGGGGARTTRSREQQHSVPSAHVGVRARVHASALLQYHLSDETAQDSGVDGAYPHVHVDTRADGKLILPPGVVLGLIDDAAAEGVASGATRVVVEDAAVASGLQPPPLYNPLLGLRANNEDADAGHDEVALLDGYTRALVQPGVCTRSGIERGAGEVLQLLSALMSLQSNQESARRKVSSSVSSSGRVASDPTFGTLVLNIEGMRQLLWGRLDPPQAAVAVAASPVELGHDGCRSDAAAAVTTDPSVLLEGFLAAEAVVAEEGPDGQLVRRVVRRQSGSSPAAVGSVPVDIAKEGTAAESSVSGHIARGSAANANKPPVCGPEVIMGLTLLQAAFRGNRVRGKLRRLLESVEYHDDEMDAILYNNGGRSGGTGTGGAADDDEFGLGDMGEMDAFMNEMLGGGAGTGGGGLCPELDDDWLSYQQPSKSRGQYTHQQGGGHSGDVDLDMSMDSQATMVYGDHIKKRRAQSGNDASSGMHGSASGVGLGVGGGKAGVSPEFDRKGLVSHPPALHPNSTAAGAGAPAVMGGAAAGGGGGERITVAAWGSTTPSAAVSRPISAMTDDQSEVGDDHEGLSSRGHGQGRGRGHASTSLPLSGIGVDSGTGGSMATSRSTKSHQSAASSSSDIAHEWGISDPVVLATIMKRNQKMRYGHMRVCVLSKLFMSTSKSYIYRCACVCPCL